MVVEALLPASAPFLVVFREALEASLIVGIVAAYLRKIERRELNRYLILGSGAAILVSVALGLGLYAAFGGLTGASAAVFEGVASISAALVLTYMIFWMAKNARRVSDELHRKLDTAISKGYLFGVAAVAFVAVSREGLETVLLLTALVGAVGVSATLTGMILGLAVVMGLTFFVVKGVYRLNLKSFFKYTSLILLVFASGLLGYGAHELIEAAQANGLVMGVLASAAYNINPADAGNLLHEKGLLGSVLKALIGYDGNPEWLRVVLYWSYWILIGSFLLKTYAPRTYQNTLGRLHRPESKTAL